MNVPFQARRFTRVPQLLTGTQVTEQLGINAFAQESLFRSSRGTLEPRSITRQRSRSASS
jgi:hypothetical protein